MYLNRNAMTAVPLQEEANTQTHSVPPLVHAISATLCARLRHIGDVRVVGAGDEVAVVHAETANKIGVALQRLETLPADRRPQLHRLHHGKQKAQCSTREEKAKRGEKEEQEEDEEEEATDKGFTTKKHRSVI